MNAIPYIISILSSVILCVMTYKLNKLMAHRDEAVKAAETKSKAIADGVQCLLRESIIRDFNKWQEKGYCPIYAKESIKRAYESYKALDGNDVAKELYIKILAMPEEVSK